MSIVDSYQIRIVAEKPDVDEQTPSLYFVNFGGYKPGIFGEFHEMSFYVGHNRKEVTSRAKQQLCAGQYQQHCDDHHIIDVDDLIEIGQVGEHYIQLQPTTLANQIIIESSYRRLDVPDIITEAEKLQAIAD